MNIGQPEPAPLPDSWKSKDVRAWLKTEHPPTMPSIGYRDDGVCLFYPGRTHALAAESEAGKSWAALHICAQEIEKGHTVTYLDFEDSIDGILERLTELTEDHEAIAEHFDYRNPEEPLWNHLELADECSGSSLVVIDGVTEAMTRIPPQVQSTDWNARVAEFNAMLANPIAAQGPAVLSLDHLVKNQKEHGRYAIGGVHKLNGLSGAQYILHTEEPCGRGLRGFSRVYVAKDRPGYVRKFCGGIAKYGMMQVAALVVDNLDDSHATTVELQSPDLFGDPAARPLDLMRSLSAYLAANDGQEMTTNQISSAVAGNKQKKIEALHALADEKYVKVRMDGRARYYMHARPFTGGNQWANAV